MAVILESEEKIDVLNYEKGKENVKLYVEALGIWNFIQIISNIWNITNLQYKIIYIFFE